MVSEQNPPMPLSMNVPPGHIVQQIVDENGALRHVILSPQAPPAPPPPPMAQTGPYPSSGRAPPAAVLSNGPTLQYIPVQGTPCGQAIHHPPLTALRFDANGQPNPAAAFYSPGGDVYPVCHNAPYRFCPSDRSVGKYRMSRYDRRRPHQDAFYGAPRMIDDSLMPVQEGAESTATTTTATTVEGSCMEREEMTKLVEMLSRIQPPEVCEVGIREALAKWQPLDCSEAAANGGPFPQIDASEFTYELMLWERRVDAKVAGKYKCGNSQCEQWIFGLKPATDYFVRLKALLEERGLHGDLTEPVSFRTKATFPDKPYPPRVVQRMKTSLLLRWSAPNDNGSKIMAYLLELEEEGAFKEVYSGPLRQAKVQKLLMSTEYRFRLAAKNQCGKSDYSELCIASTSGAAPCQPEPPWLIEAKADQLTLGWQRSDADEYQLFMEDMDSGYGFLPACTTQECSYTVYNLQRCKQYRFRLVASNEDGQAPPSDVITFCTLPTAPSCPGTPAVHGRLHSTQAKIVWNPPDDFGGCDDVDEYTLQVREKSSSDGWMSVYAGAQREFQLTNLSPGTAYQCRVRCKGAGGESPFSEIGLFTTMAVHPGPVKVPTIAGKVKATGVHVKWNQPETTGGAEIKDYEVELCWLADEDEPDGAARLTAENFEPRIVYQGPKMECNIQLLLPGRSYRLRVRANNIAGPGAWSEPLNFRTAPSAPDCPLDLRCIASTANSLHIAWNPPLIVNGASIVEYRLSRAVAGSSRQQHHRKVSYSSSCSASSLSSATTPSSPSPSVADGETESSSSVVGWGPFECIFYGNALSHEVRSLLPDSEYAFHVQAVNSVGVSPPSAQLVCRTQPGPPGCPVNLTAEPLSLYEILLTWEAPVDHGRPVVSYNLEVIPCPDDHPSPVVVSADTLSYTFDNLSPETSYRFRVQACNECGIGPYAAPIRAVTLSPPPVAPLLELASAGHNFLKLKWSDRRRSTADDGGRTYFVEMENRLGGHSPVYEGPAKSCKVPRLTENTVYTFRVRASSKNGGMGAWSDPVQFCTGRTPPPPLKAPIRIVDVAETTAAVEWSAVKMSLGEGDKLAYAVELRHALAHGGRFLEDVKLCVSSENCSKWI
ncbi:hypothetical protein M514_07706 [Trichuris suis]|uniref:Fibronectin type-III domain-containing protein n=1 Tax=Trichuris suis TaxID=68888 RepID=A0A085M2P7_9BILA|nr:hypothetical protein M513_07706 [Trichuris suis]KFD61956.1 hypothetical protein M514_07706 [Trichuris suis]